MQQKTLMDALPILAKFLGRKLGVHVVLNAARAETDGKTIYLPPLPDDDQARILAHGFIDHEGAHVRYTDFSVRRLSTPFAGDLQDVLEDVRIEQALYLTLPGCGSNLKRLYSHLLAIGALRIAAQAAPPAQQVLNYLRHRLYADVLGHQALQPTAAEAEQRVSTLLPRGAMVRLRALAFEVTRARSTQDVLRLSERIIAMLEEEAEQPPPPTSARGNGLQSQEGLGHDRSQADNSQRDSNRQDGDNQGHDAQDHGNGQGDNAQGASQGQGHDTQADGNAQAGNGQGDDAGGSSSSDKTQGTGQGQGVGQQGTGEILREILAASADDLGGSFDSGRQLARLLNDAARTADTAAVMAEPDPVPTGAPAGPVLARARRATAALRRQLAVLVEASRQQACWRSPRGHRLNGRELYRLSCNDAGIFQRRAAVDAPDTAVMLLLDRSGSMRDRIALANQATLAVAVALREIAGCTVGVGAFPGSTADRVIPLLGYDEKVTRVAGRFQIDAGGGTPLAPALWWAGYQLLLQPQPRKLLLVVTDGQPDQPEQCREVIQRCHASGLEVMGLGINAQHTVTELFGRDAENIESIDELAPRLFQLLQRRLTTLAA